jgi:hypothetical protein
MYPPCVCRQYPFRNQERELLRQSEESRFLGNCALTQRTIALKVNTLAASVPSASVQAMQCGYVRRVYINLGG